MADDLTIWDKATELQDTIFSTSQVAEIVPVPLTDLRTWIDRHGLFSERKAGSGSHFAFRLKDVFTVAAVSALVNGGGLSPKHAVQAVSNYSIYGAFLHTKEPRRFFLSRNSDGTWVGAGSMVTLELDVDALWRSLKPGLAKMVGADLIDATDEVTVRALAGERHPRWV